MLLELLFGGCYYNISAFFPIATHNNIITHNIVHDHAGSRFTGEEKGHVPFIYYERLDCDNTGLDCVIKDHDITLRIPEGAVAEGEKVHFEVGVAMYGPFHHPANTQPISPILWLHVVEGIKLNKQFELMLPHCCTQLDQLSFAITDHNSSKHITEDDAGQPHYLFEVHSNGAKFYTDPMCGTIQTDCCNHAFCIVKHTNYGHWCRDVSFLLARVDLRPSQTVHEFHFYSVFNLATHRKVP